MAMTCVLGHPWSDGMVLCPSCGFGRRNIDQVGAVVAPAAAEVPARHEQAVGVLVGAGGGPALPRQEQILSPDGYWAWDGAAWVPAAAEPVAPEPQFDDADEPTPSAPLTEAPRPRRLVLRRRAAGAESTPADHARTHRTRQTRLLIGLVGVAAVVAGDLALHLPPLGHPAASPAAVTVLAHHAAGANARDGFARHLLAEGAAAETAYRASTGHYTGSAVLLRAHGLPTVAAPAALIATLGRGTGYCLTATATRTGHRWFLDDSATGGLQTTVFASPAAALARCFHPG